MTHYIVISEKEIVKAEMERPEDIVYQRAAWYTRSEAPAEWEQIEKYRDHCLFLPGIPIEGEHKWKLWDEVELGKDFKLESTGVENPYWSPGNREPKFIDDTIAIPIQPTPEGEKVEELIKRLHTLMPYHINPYNLGEMGEISIIISKLYNQIKSGYAAAPAKGMRDEFKKAFEEWMEADATFLNQSSVPEIAAASQRLNDKIKGLKKAYKEYLDESPSDSEADHAIEFAEWITKSGYDLCGVGKWALIYTSADDEKEYTTAELYHQFKKQ